MSGSRRGKTEEAKRDAMRAKHFSEHKSREENDLLTSSPLSSTQTQAVREARKGRGRRRENDDG